MGIYWFSSSLVVIVDLIYIGKKWFSVESLFIIVGVVVWVIVFVMLVFLGWVWYWYVC